MELRKGHILHGPRHLKTEIYCFYEGPIDNEVDGPEGLINAWPLDESYIDYIEGNPDAGIINMPDEYPTIDAELLVSLNEEDGEENVSTGWHAIEFLLWGQDMNLDGPGYRPVEDYTTSPNADRRGTYLAVASDVLIGHLQDMVDAWAPGQSNYRAEFVSKDTDEAITNMTTGIGEMSRGELVGERMTVAYGASAAAAGTPDSVTEGTAFVRWLTGKVGFSAGGLALLVAARYQWQVGGALRYIAPLSVIIGLAMQNIWVDALTVVHRVSGVAVVVWLLAIGFMLTTERVERLFLSRFGLAASGN